MPNTPGKLRKFLLETAVQCVHQPEGQLKLQFVTPSYKVTAGLDDRTGLPERSRVGHYLQMYDWDACFFSQCASKLGLDHLPSAVVGNFLSLEREDGYIPRTISPHRVWDQGDLCKPFLCQTLIHSGCHLNHDHPTREKLRGYLNYIDKHRRHQSGLYRWRNVLESGVDNNFALLAPLEAARDKNRGVSSFPDGHLLAVDLSAYLVKELAAFGRLAGDSGDPKLACEYADRSDRLARLIEDACWDNDAGLYCNLHPDSLQAMTIRTWTGLTPVLLGFAQADRAEQVIRCSLMNEERFLRPTGISSTAASEVLYNQAKRGLYGRIIVSNWQGPMWVLPNALAVRALIGYGFMKEAQELSARVVTTLCRVLAETGTLFENYHAETGKPLWAPQFMSWNLLALEMIDLIS